LADFHISATALETSAGIPCPPMSGLAGIACQPASMNCRYASGKPSGVATLPSLQRQPWRSPVAFKGANTSPAKRAASVRIASTSSGSASSKPGKVAISGSPATWLSTKRMSSKGAA
jgi:hypothetical protein